MSEQDRPAGGRRGPRKGQSAGGPVNIDFGFGELFKGLGGFLELVGDMAKEGTSETAGTREIHGPGGVRGVYGFSVKVGLGGKPVVERFGNVHSTERGPEVSEVREPLVDVFDEGDHVLVVAELPGIAERDVKIEIRDDILTLSAEGRDRKYAKELLLPAKVDPTTVKQSYQNGVLEVSLNKAS